jgi:hypothetical protein
MAWSLSEKDYSSIRNQLAKNGLSPSIMRDEQEFKYLRTPQGCPARTSTR